MSYFTRTIPGAVYSHVSLGTREDVLISFLPVCLIFVLGYDPSRRITPSPVPFVFRSPSFHSKGGGKKVVSFLIVTSFLILFEVSLRLSWPGNLQAKVKGSRLTEHDNSYLILPEIVSSSDVFVFHLFCSNKELYITFTIKILRLLIIL